MSLGLDAANDGVLREFPGGPVVRTLGFHCRGCGFDAWMGN